MKCPVCKEVSLSMNSREGIEIDYCPQCRGIWLDRGELDRLIQRTEAAAPEPSRDRAPERYREEYRDKDRHEHYPKRRKSLLSELFDF